MTSTFIPRWRPPGAPPPPPLREWFDQGLCGREEGDWFAVQPAPVQAAKEVCGRCPVQEVCLAFALDAAETSGIWGGLTTEERRVIARSHLRDHTAETGRIGNSHYRAVA